MARIYKTAAVATVIALAGVLLGTAALLWGAFFIPMAVTIMGGLTFATVLTLVVVPVPYATVFRIPAGVAQTETRS